MKLTFAFFKFKVPNFKQFLWNVGPSNMSESYRDAKAVLDNVKRSAWSHFKFWVSREEIDKSFVHCKLCLDKRKKRRSSAAAQRISPIISKLGTRQNASLQKRRRRQRKVSSITLVVAKAKQCQSGSSPVNVGSNGRSHRQVVLQKLAVDKK